MSQAKGLIRSLKSQRDSRVSEITYAKQKKNEYTLKANSMNTFIKDREEKVKKLNEEIKSTKAIKIEDGPPIDIGKNIKPKVVGEKK